MRKVTLLLLILALAGIVRVPAQSGSVYAFIIYAEGYNLSIFRNEQLTTYDVLVDDVLGLPLLPGDLIQTDAETFVEIQVMPSRTVLKVAENTTFEIENLGGSGGGTFQMTYGRVRARVERITTDEEFQIRGFSAVAGVRGTDFGFDVVVEREGTAEIETAVYVFDGEVDVAEVPDTATDASGEAPPEPQTVRLGANEMVSVVAPAPPTAPTPADDAADGAPDSEAESEPVAPDAPATARPVSFQSRSIDEEIASFWQSQDFREEPVDPDEVEEAFPGITARVDRLSEEQRQFEELQRLRREGLLLNPADRLAELAEDAFEPLVPEPEPERVQLGPAPPDSEIRRLITPSDGPTVSRRFGTASLWFGLTGVAMGGTGFALEWFGPGIETLEDLTRPGVGTALMAGGTVFLSASLVTALGAIITR